MEEAAWEKQGPRVAALEEEVPLVVAAWEEKVAWTLRTGEPTNFSLSLSLSRSLSLALSLSLDRSRALSLSLSLAHLHART